MNVWVVYPFAGDPCPPEAVFSTEEAAREWAKRMEALPEYEGINYHVSEFAVDAAPEIHECVFCFESIVVYREDDPTLQWDEDHEKVAHASCVKEAKELAEEAQAEDRYWARRGW